MIRFMAVKRTFFVWVGVFIVSFVLVNWALVFAAENKKSMKIHINTPAPKRFIVRNTTLIDLEKGKKPVFFHGMGYSPYLAKETPLYGDLPGNDDRYAKHLPLMQDLGVDYLHIFPRMMPAKFFTALDKTDMVYGQDVWIWAYADDLLDQTFQQTTLSDIKEVIDHTYKIGRPDRLVLFSIGDELQASAVIQTNKRHPNVHAYHGKHLTVTHRTPTEVALAMFIDKAMDYELSQYGQRHLYCHTSWTHIGPLSDRPDLELSYENVLLPDMGDLICLNVYPYARGVMTSPKGSVTGTTYQGYLEQLAAKTDQPIFVTQVGLSTSPIIPKPWVTGFGGHKAEDVPNTYRSVWKDIHTAKGHQKFCGMAFFEFNDEWWKSGDDPDDFNQHEPEDPEEWFGIYKVGQDNHLLPKGEIPETIKSLFKTPDIK